MKRSGWSAGACALALGAGVLGGWASAAASVVGPTLELVRTDAIGPVIPGEVVVVQLRMRNLTEPAAGYQAFLEFDEAHLEFMSGSYTSSPFGLGILGAVTADAGRINLAAGIDQMGGQPPSSADAVLVEMHFMAVGLSCKPQLNFRAANPPTRLTALGGEEIGPLALLNPVSGCPCDWNCNAVVNSQDFFDFLAVFFVLDPSADFNADGFVNSQDFFDFLACFFGEPEGCRI